MAQTSSGLTDPPARLRHAGLVPGTALCVAVAVASVGLELAENWLLGRAWLEGLVIAILLGTAIRTAWAPGPRWQAGIAFSARTLLEIAVVLLGMTVSAATILATGPALLCGIAGVVGLALAASYGLGRLFGLPHRLATLIACGNSICGNSAIAAVAPVIGANGQEIAAAIAFTAVLGVPVVLGLPVLAAALHMTPESYGIFAGLTVYAVPQVLAATMPVSAVSAQIGTLVKLVRVLMLGPVILALGLMSSRARPASHARVRTGLALRQAVPWFIIGFLLLVAIRSTGIVTLSLAAPVARLATWLTIISMAALGLGVDVRVVAKAGPRVTAVVTLSLLALGAIAWLLLTLRGGG